MKCSRKFCNYVERDQFRDPIVPSLAIPTEAPQPTLSSNVDGSGAAASMMAAIQYKPTRKELDISDAGIPLSEIEPEDLPRCPKCHDISRPGVVWFGESLPEDTIAAVDGFIEDSEKIDLILVIGTSSKVYPAAAYVDIARKKGARVAVVNMDRSDVPGDSGSLNPGDWFFEGDASVLVPEMLEPVVGRV